MTVFMLEMRGENGVISIIDDTGNPPEVAVYSSGIVVASSCPITEHLTMVSDVKGVMIGHSGIESSTECAIIFHRAMMDVERGALALFSRETLAGFHNSSIAELNENDMSVEPMKH